MNDEYIYSLDGVRVVPDRSMLADLEDGQETSAAGREIRRQREELLADVEDTDDGQVTRENRRHFFTFTKLPLLQAGAETTTDTTVVDAELLRWTEVQWLAIGEESPGAKLFRAKFGGNRVTVRCRHCGWTITDLVAQGDFFAVVPLNEGHWQTRYVSANPVDSQGWTPNVPLRVRLTCRQDTCRRRYPGQAMRMEHLATAWLVAATYGKQLDYPFDFGPHDFPYAAESEAIPERPATIRDQMG